MHKPLGNWGSITSLKDNTANTRLGGRSEEVAGVIRLPSDRKSVIHRRKTTGIRSWYTMNNFNALEKAGGY